MAATWETPPDKSGRGLRRWGVMAIAAAVVVAIVIAAVLAIEGHRSAKTGSSPVTVTPASITSSVSSGATTAAITPTSTSPSPTVTAIAVPTAAPAGVTWSLVQGVALPTSPVDGPTKVSGPVFAGYSHTPTGALLAASQISSRYLIADSGWQQIVSQQIAPGPGRDAFTKLRAPLRSNPPPAEGYGQFAAFKFVTYTPSVAVIELATKFRNGSLQVSTETVVWAGTDWQLQLQPDGASTPSIQPVTSLAGYAIWSGIS